MPLWAPLYTCLEIVQATIIMAVLYEVRLGSSEEPLGRVDSKLFSVLNLGPAKEEVHNLLFRILNSLKRVLTDPLFQLAVSPRDTTLSWQLATYENYTLRV